MTGRPRGGHLRLELSLSVEERRAQVVDLLEGLDLCFESLLTLRTRIGDFTGDDEAANSAEREHHDEAREKIEHYSKAIFRISLTASAVKPSAIA